MTKEYFHSASRSERAVDNRAFGGIIAVPDVQPRDSAEPLPDGSSNAEPVNRHERRKAAAMARRGR